MKTTQSRLHRLGDNDLRLEHPSEDIRGRTVLDSNGEEIGTVDELFIDDRERRVRYIQVASGGFLHLGQTKFLIPSDAISSVNDVNVHVDSTRERISGVPVYDPKVIDDPYLTRVSKYFGREPYWASEYRRPPNYPWPF
jgi:sporulation protein YlmC with PRC-barrel domain